ncbi:unnamed protein product [Staurois parvus]|uniref:Uncharacterized protein n=1 Tax=Staurois parvus TaxID=386267 RepID=A0ABN9HQX2_9NEOB|nr:unnamed protein product [Staurois parvus]
MGGGRILCSLIELWEPLLADTSKKRSLGTRGGMTIWKLGHCPRAWGQ